MSLFCYSFVLSLWISGVITAKSCYPDYYWRDFSGDIPEDAIVGSRNNNSGLFYIAQAYFRNNELLPATIFPGKKKARASAYNKVLDTEENVKILCSKNAENLKWVSNVESKNLLKLVEENHVVVGGSEVGQVLYIGKIINGEEEVLGKIFKHSQGNRGIWVPSKDGHETNSNNVILPNENTLNLGIMPQKKCEGYYWRDFNGDIPTNAIIGGRYNGETVYIGQVYVKGYELLPGMIIPSLGVVRAVAYQYVFNQSKWTKILCTWHPEALVWVTTNTTELPTRFPLVNNLIPGGSEVGETLYIARVAVGNDLIVGKYFRDGCLKSVGIGYPANANTVANSLTYEVLTYKCDL